MSDCRLKRGEEGRGDQERSLFKGWRGAWPGIMSCFANSPGCLSTVVSSAVLHIRMKIHARGNMAKEECTGENTTS
jgi:hypothetical protein